MCVSRLHGIHIGEKIDWDGPSWYPCYEWWVV